ncbi:MAG: DNA polymerase III subunit delta [Chloroflexi bacterium]|nr:DNA polymerase III subunit delta [Chloroflexota bacterium]MBM3173848.1 DNA polymerase III subunit delta [Chloroflexota bacterium]MBM3174187.1 DNA polymerase III subunit delta [Chloroflexota bacterium]MBM4449816.1 DNA polymerase III subunit delta [Chloroflexota bacterium]
MLYILYGKDDFTRHQALEDIKKRICDAETLAINTCLLAGKQLSLKQLEDACNVYPSLLCPSRLVIVEGLLGRFEARRKKGRRTANAEDKASRDLEEWLGLVALVKGLPATTELVLIDGELQPQNRLLGALLSLAKVKVFSALRAEGLCAWVQSRVKDRGGTITPGAVDALVALVGADLWAMSGEIDKLLAYSQGHYITEEDVKKAGSCIRDADIFALVDAILEGRREVAQQWLQRLLQSGAGPPYILVMTTRQLRLITAAKELGSDLFRSEVRAGLEQPSDFSLQKASRQARAYSRERIRAAYHKLAETDVDIKSGKYDNELGLNLLIIELSRV